MKIKKQEKVDLNKLILLCSFAAQIIMFAYELVNNTMYCDEVMTILNARSIADRGTDITGEAMPFYFDTWVYGGQSPFATYVMALFIRLFGYSLFVSRLPMLIISLLSLYVFYLFAKEIFDGRQEYVAPALLFCGISPWHIFSGTYTLDCNFFPHFFLIGCLFLVKAIKSAKPTGLYMLAMLFFGIAFYCYIASAYIIPFMLTAVYIYLLIKRKITFKNAAISVAALTVVSLPFILFGLVTQGIIEPFTLCGINFNEMPYFDKVEHYSSAADFLKSAAKELWYGITLLILPDTFITKGTVSVFTYTYGLGGFFAGVGIIYLLIKLKSDKNYLSQGSRAILFGGLVTGILFCIVARASLASAHYRFGALNYLAFIPLGVGFAEIFRLLKNDKVRTALKASAVSLSVIILSVVYIFSYQAMQAESYTAYGREFLNAAEFAQEQSEGNFAVCNVRSKNANDTNMRIAVYLNYCYYGEKELAPLDEDIIIRGGLAEKYKIKEYMGKTNIQLTRDNSVRYIDASRESITDDCFIAYRRDLEGKIKIAPKDYKEKRFGPWVVMYKN